MPLQTLFSLIMLALAGTWTPGPNNALLARSGTTFGLHATLPHIFGVALGFPLMAFTVGWFLGELFQTSATLREVLRWGSAVLLLWVGWQIASAGAPESRAADAKPFGFWQAAAFQWNNPKGWTMAISTASLYSNPSTPVKSALIIASVLLLSGITSAVGWAWLGQVLSHWLGHGGRLRTFNIVMGLTVAAGVVVLFVE